MTEQKRTIFSYFRSGFRFVRRSLFLVALLVSIAINCALLLSDVFLGAASVAARALTGKPSLVTQQADDIARLQAENAAEKKAHREAREELAETSGELVAERKAKQKARKELSTTSAELAAERIARRELRSQLADKTIAVAALSNASKTAKKEAAEAATRVSARMKKAAVRETAAMPAEALPWLGATVIVAATTLELADMCATIKDMTKLQRALDPKIVAPPEQAQVCGMQVPTKEEILEAAKKAPGKVWQASVDLMPTAEELKSIDISEIDWKDVGESIADTTVSWGSAAVEAGASLGAAATEKAKAGAEKLKYWWETEEE